LADDGNAVGAWVYAPVQTEGHFPSGVRTVSDYLAFYVIVIFQMVLLAQFTDLLGGHRGRISVASVLFAAIGGYSYALFAATFRIGPWLAVLFAILTTSILAFISSYLLMHLCENDFLLATLSAQMGLIELVNNLSCFGGPLGIRNIPTPSIGTTLIDPSLNAIWILAPAVLISSIVLPRLLDDRSSFGRVVHWIRDDELSAAAFGLSVSRLQVALLVIVGGFSGLAGIGIVVAQGYVSPGSFDLWLSLTVLTVVYLSGTGANPLAMFGGSVTFVVLNESLRSFGSRPELVGPVQQITLNAILIAVLLVRRRGFAGPIIAFGPSANELE